MEKLEIVLLGVESGCKRCARSHANIEKFMEKNSDKYMIRFSKLNIDDPSVIAKYGIVRPPAVIMNGIIVSENKIPDIAFLEKAAAEVINRRR